MAAAPGLSLRRARNRVEGTTGVLGNSKIECATETQRTQRRIEQGAASLVQMQKGRQSGKSSLFATNPSSVAPSRAGIVPGQNAAALSKHGPHLLRLNKIINSFSVLSVPLWHIQSYLFPNTASCSSCTG